MGSLPVEVYNLHDKQVIKTCLTLPVMWPMADWYLKRKLAPLFYDVLTKSESRTGAGYENAMNIW